MFETRVELQLMVAVTGACGLALLRSRTMSSRVPLCLGGTLALVGIVSALLLAEHPDTLVTWETIRVDESKDMAIWFVAAGSALFGAWGLVARALEPHARS